MRPTPGRLLAALEDSISAPKRGWARAQKVIYDKEQTPGSSDSALTPERPAQLAAIPHDFVYRPNTVDLVWSDENAAVAFRRRNATRGVRCSGHAGSRSDQSGSYSQREVPFFFHLMGDHAAGGSTVVYVARPRRRFGAETG